jgi:hypothetical protein
MIKSGRNGKVSWDPTGAGGVTLVPVLSLNKWKLSLKTNKIDVTCFGDVNNVYVPGMKDIDGSVSGFWNSEELALFEATSAVSPGQLELVPDTTDGPTFVFKGLAYLDADIDTDVAGAPAVSGTVLAAGPWSIPVAA